MTQCEKDFVSWSVLLLVVILMMSNIANANDDHDHDDQWSGINMMALMFFESLLSSQVIGEILDTLGLTECKTTRYDQHINQRSRKLLNYDETLSPKEANIW